MQLGEVFKNINKVNTKDDNIFILKSTVVPGTTEKIQEKYPDLGERNTQLAAVLMGVVQHAIKESLRVLFNTKEWLVSSAEPVFITQFQSYPCRESIQRYLWLHTAQYRW